MSSSSSLPLDPIRSKPFKHLDGKGHRQRMRHRLLDAPHQLKEYELIEMVLYLLIPRKDTKPLSKKILNYFGSIDKFLQASDEDFSMLRLPKRTSELLDFINQITYRLISPDVTNRPCFRVWKDVLSYLDSYKLHTHSSKKILRLLFLNSDQRLICDEFIDDQGSSSIATIIEKAIEYFSTNLVVVTYISDSHFSKTHRREEARFSMHLQKLAYPFNLNISDHIIAVDKQYYSLFKMVT